MWEGHSKRWEIAVKTEKSQELPNQSNFGPSLKGSKQNSLGQRPRNRTREKGKHCKGETNRPHIVAPLQGLTLHCRLPGALPQADLLQPFGLKRRFRITSMHFR